jgi:hypothetical protein
MHGLDERYHLQVLEYAMEEQQVVAFLDRVLDNKHLCMPDYIELET